jgi:hypothetical protein
LDFSELSAGYDVWPTGWNGELSTGIRQIAAKIAVLAFLKLKINIRAYTERVGDAIRRKMDKTVTNFAVASLSIYNQPQNPRIQCVVADRIIPAIIATEGQWRAPIFLQPQRAGRWQLW